MFILSIARIIMDLCLYLSFTAFIFSISGLTINVGLCFFIMAAVATASCALSKKPLIVRIIPLLGLVFCFIPANNLWDCLVSVPGCVYVTVMAIRGKWIPSFAYVSENFKRFAVIYTCFIIIAFLARCAAYVEQYSLPFIVVWILLSMYLMRTLRQSSEDLLSTRYQLLNGAAVGVIGGIGILLSSDAMLEGLLKALGVVYNYTVIPLLNVIGYILIGILWVLSKIFNAVGLKLILEEITKNGVGGSIQEENTPLIEGGGAPTFLKYLIILIAVSLFIGAIVYFVRRLIRSQQAPEKAVKSIVREKIVSENEEKKHRELFARGSNREKVRFYYRRYLEQCRKMGIPVDGSMTSMDIYLRSTVLMEAEPSADIRRVWLPARYKDGGDLDDSYVETAKDAVKKLKK